MTMQKFMLLIREDLKKLSRATDAELDAELQEMLSWTKSIASTGNLISTEPLETTGRYVSKKKVLSDGPFIEAKEGVAGYFIILAKNIDDAVSLAQTCPLVIRDQAVIEVRPIFAFEKNLNVTATGHIPSNL
jgi:hypothetical protein